MYQLRDALRGIQPDTRCRRCGASRVGPVVTLHLGAEGAARYGRVVTCGSVWACPVCTLAIRAERATEVRAVVEAHVARHGAATARLVSATVAHGLGDDLARVRRGVSRAWRRVRQGRAWQVWCARTGYVGDIRALEITHGGYAGWHPHLHVVLLFARDLAAEDAEWLRSRWHDAVVAELGAEHAPSDEHGLVITPCRAASYLAKLGLEVTDPGTKSAKLGHRTPLEIARDYALYHRVSDAALWCDWCHGMHGARMLTWSRGLRERYGLGAEPNDAELAVERDGDVIAELDRHVWAVLGRVRGGRLALLHAAERAGYLGVRAYLVGLGARASPSRTCVARWTAPGTELRDAA